MTMTDQLDHLNQKQMIEELPMRVNRLTYRHLLLVVILEMTMLMNMLEPVMVKVVTMKMTPTPVVTELYPTTTKTMFMRGLTCVMKMMLTRTQVTLMNFVLFMTWIMRVCLITMRSNKVKAIVA